MSMVCSECHNSFDQALQCPTCGVRLHYQPDSRFSALPAAGRARWHSTPWGRLLVGIMLSQGLGHGLKMLCTAGLLAASEGSSSTVWATLFGLVLLQALYALSLVVGGAITAAGQRGGLFLGAVVGAVSGFLFLTAQMVSAAGKVEVSGYAQPVLAVVFGALGGLIGSAIWKPLPSLRLPGASSPRKSAPSPSGRPSALDGPVSWGRVAVGVGIVACAVLWPAVLLNFVVDASQGTFRLETHLQTQLITWEVTGLLMLLGGGFAGATTRSGLKHGLLVGLGGAVLLAGQHLGGRTAVQEHTLLVVASLFSLTAAGGWFGAQLFPPVEARRRKVSTLA